MCSGLAGTTIDETEAMGVHWKASKSQYRTCTCSATEDTATIMAGQVVVITIIIVVQYCVVGLGEKERGWWVLVAVGGAHTRARAHTTPGTS